MGHAPVILAVWGFSVVLLIVVKLYVSRLSRDEEDQIFLGDSFEQEKSTQAAIAARVQKAQPIQRAALWLVGAMTLVVIAYYVLDIIHQFD